MKIKYWPFKVSLCAVAWCRCHGHWVCLSHNAPGCGLQLSVDSFDSHQTRLTLQGPKTKPSGKKQSLKLKWFCNSVSTINNLQDTISHVCKEHRSCSAHIYGLVACGVLSSATVPPLQASHCRMCCLSSFLRYFFVILRWTTVKEFQLQTLPEPNPFLATCLCVGSEYKISRVQKDVKISAACFHCILHPTLLLSFYYHNILSLCIRCH